MRAGQRGGSSVAVVAAASLAAEVAAWQKRKLVGKRGNSLSNPKLPMLLDSSFGLLVGIKH